MKNTRNPTKEEIAELVSFLPKLYAEGFNSVKQWRGGQKDQSGVISMPYPEYDAIVDEFFYAAANECWLDYNYRPEEARQMLDDEDFIQTSSLSQIKTMLTFCVRGERFSDGHWAEMIENGTIRRLLERLIELGANPIEKDEN